MARLKLIDEDRRLFTSSVLLLCLLSYYGSCASITQGPVNATVLSGSNAQFICIFSEGWGSILWFYKGISVVSITPASGAYVSSDQVQIIMNNSTDSITRRFTSQMSLIKVTKDNSGEIGCSFVGTSPQNAYLSVQVNGSLQITNGSITTLPNKTIDIFCKAAGWYPDPVITWQINNTFLNTLDYVTSYTPGNNGLQDAVSILTIHTQDNVSISCLASIESLAAPQSTSVNLIVTEYPPVPAPKNNTETIIIAVTVTIGVLLLIVIIIVIVVCCWKKKQTDTSYQSEAWKMSSKSAGDISNSGKSFTGERNAGYIPETPPKGARYQEFLLIHLHLTTYI